MDLDEPDVMQISANVPVSAQIYAPVKKNCKTEIRAKHILRLDREKGHKNCIAANLTPKQLFLNEKAAEKKNHANAREFS